MTRPARHTARHAARHAPRLVHSDELRERLSPEARTELDALVAEVSTDPSCLGRTFPAAARRVGRGDLGVVRDGAPVLIEDAVRVELVEAAAGVLDTEQLVREVAQLYRFGDNDEKRAVLHALNTGVVRDCGDDIVLDALRTNDTRLVAAAMGHYATEHLGDESWRQGVLKCLFVGVALHAVDGLGSRADAQLAAMVARFVHERVAAGRDVPPDVWLVLNAHPQALEAVGLERELASPFPDRRAAAERLLDSRPTQEG